MKRKSILRNNKGGGLILVIGCVALLSLIGAMLLVVTSNNRKMKDLERQMQASYYGTESRSDAMVAQLEIEAEDALKRAFADLMVQYSESGTDNVRNDRFAQFFQEAFKAEVSDSTAADTIMRKALDLGPTDALDVDVEFGSVETTPYTTGDTTTEICIKNAKFTYSANGTQTSITTDIKVKTTIPDIEGNMMTPLVCDFSDFALITGEETEEGDLKEIGVLTNLNTSQTVKINGNLYTKGDLVHKSKDMTLEVTDANKILVARDLKVTNGAKMKITGGTQASGDGVWAEGIEVTERGILDADSNFYVADDLTIEQKGTLPTGARGPQVIIKGGEYIGYSGDETTTDAPTANSAITINTAKDITLDMSGTRSLVLSGKSYIRDAHWGSAAGLEDALGILQGESVAYKDMQSMYLVPGECLTTKHNPMTLEEYTTAAAAGCLLTGTTITYEDADTHADRTFSFREYLDIDLTDPDAPLRPEHYEVRHVKLDGGATEFVYLYINFKDDSKVQQYFRDYMAVEELAAPIKKRLENLGNSTIKLAQHNYTVANAFTLEPTESAGLAYAVQEATNNYAFVTNNRDVAKRRTSGLFSSFRVDAVSSEPDGRDFDIIAEKILKSGKFPSEASNSWLVQETYEVNEEEYDFWVYDGNLTLTGDTPTNSGIILVNGRLTFSSTSKNFSGLVLATKGVEFNSSTTLNCDPDAVEALLTVADVQEYFQVSGSGGTPATPYISSEAVTISFDNWQKN